jgi:hypothetical protein
MLPISGPLTLLTGLTLTLIGILLWRRGARIE